MSKIEKVESGIVFSNDIYRILKGKNAIDFSYEKAGLVIPSEDQIVVLRQDFAKDVNKIFKNDVTIYSEEEMEMFLGETLTDIDSYPLVSLDKIYYDDSKIGNISYYLDCTRLDGVQELVSRKNPNDKKSVEYQIQKIAKELKMKNKNQILLIDDVVFSGNALRKLISIFGKYDIKVVGIRAAISTEKSYEYFNRCLKEGLKCGCLLGDEVIDQVCERDFYFGIAQSGISMLDSNKQVVKAPYFKPFGDPENRSSIPQVAVSFFSNGCLLRSMRLWNDIEDNSKKEIYIKDLPEKIVHTRDNDRVIDLLRKGLIFYEKDTNRSNGIGR